MGPNTINIERTVAKLHRLVQSMPTVKLKALKAEARVAELQQTRPNDPEAKAEIEALKGALRDPSRLEADIATVKADLAACADLIAKA